MERISVLSINVNSGTSDEFVNEIASIAVRKKSQYVCIANVHMLVEAYKDAGFANIVNNASLITPDGMPLTWAIRMLHNIKQERVAGMDLLPALLEKASSLKLSVFFYGGTDKMLSRTKTYLKEKYPGVDVVGTYNPPFRNLTLEEDDKVVELINNSNAALIFVVLGCPKQERWMASMKERINAVMIGVGGALPVLISMQRRAPAWMQSVGLEWVFRLIQEPRRLFKRYAVTNSTFIYILFKEYFLKLRRRFSFN
ncbi:MAG: WecB/TagA/CpsF family glycosyltransferase [Bacteroidota bacterium]|nr:WecB/TagA/CpsF family glycosyltransferase [Bacteroidota bacterium]